MSLIPKQLWLQLLEEGKRIGIPPIKKRGIIREFLQTQILYYLYQVKESRFLLFTGGTCLRFLYNHKRLSEDLDFDLIRKNLPLKEILEKVAEKQAAGEKNAFNFKFKLKEKGAAGYFNYNNLLYELDISNYRDEKLVIKFDFDYPEDKIMPQTKIFTKFGYLQSVLTYDQSTLLSFKTRALMTRKTERGRDLYDIAKLLSFNIEPNFKIIFLKKRGIKTMEDYFRILKGWSIKHKKLIPSLKRQLEPFLIDEEEIKYLDLLTK